MASFLFILPVAGKLDAFHLVIATRSVVPFFLYSGNVVFPYRRGTSGNILHHNTRNPNAHCTPQLHGLSCLTSIKRNQWILNQHSFCLVMRGKRLTAKQARNKAPGKLFQTNFPDVYGGQSLIIDTHSGSHVWDRPYEERRPEKDKKILSSQNIYNCSSLDENQLACLWNKTLDWSSESNLQWIVLINSSFKSYFAVQVQNTDTIVLWF